MASEERNSAHFTSNEKAKHLRPGSAGTFGRRSVTIEIIDDPSDEGEGNSPTDSLANRLSTVTTDVSAGAQQPQSPQSSQNSHSTHAIVTRYLQQQIKSPTSPTFPPQPASIHFARRSTNTRRKSRYSIISPRSSRISSGSAVLWRSFKRDTHTSRASSASAAASSARDSMATSTRSSGPVPLRVEILVGENAGEEVRNAGEEWEVWEDVDGGEVSMKDLMTFMKFADEQGVDSAWDRFSGDFVSEQRAAEAMQPPEASQVPSDQVSLVSSEEKRTSRISLEMWFEQAKHELFSSSTALDYNPLPSPSLGQSAFMDTNYDPSAATATVSSTSFPPPDVAPFTLPVRTSSRECLSGVTTEQPSPKNKKKNREVRVVGLAEEDRREDEGDVYMMFPGASEDGDVPAGEDVARRVKGAMSIERLRGTGGVWEKRRTVEIMAAVSDVAEEEDEEEGSGSSPHAVDTQQTSLQDANRESIPPPPDTPAYLPGDPNTFTNPSVATMPNRGSRASSVSFRNRYSLAPSMASSERFHPPSMSHLDPDEINFILNERWSVSTFASATWAAGVQNMTEEEFLRMLANAGQARRPGEGSAEAEGDGEVPLEVRYDQLVARLRLAGIEVPVSARPVAVPSEAGDADGTETRPQPPSVQHSPAVSQSLNYAHRLSQQRYMSPSGVSRMGARTQGGTMLGKKKEKEKEKGKNKTRQKDYEEVARRLKMAGLMDVAMPDPPKEKNKGDKGTATTAPSAAAGSVSGTSNSPASTPTAGGTPASSPASSATSTTLVNPSLVGGFVNMFTGASKNSAAAIPKAKPPAPASLATVTIPNRGRVLSRLRKGSQPPPIVETAPRTIDGTSYHPTPAPTSTPLTLPAIQPPSPASPIHPVPPQNNWQNAAIQMSRDPMMRTKRRSGGNPKRHSGEGEEIRRNKRMSRLITGFSMVPLSGPPDSQITAVGEESEKDLEWEDIEITFVDKLVEKDPKRSLAGTPSLNSLRGVADASPATASLPKPTALPTPPRTGSPNFMTTPVAGTPGRSGSPYGTYVYTEGGPVTPPQTPPTEYRPSAVPDHLMSATEAMGMRPVQVAGAPGSIVSIGTVLRNGPPTRVGG
ncbi:hypothetical protein HK097_002809 [Rhizophlyctis rosea]|uniref:Uncharacterized protein n=1 Tax=Rhizophlyctis rosea TaxID=64517 RepID=A0AAD5SIA4_9FUNG|nr:hypothetical protein HK097_002809 [Rhizophlyctis rosea]